MNKTQIDYALKRIDSMLARKVEDSQQRHAKEASTLTSERRCELIRTGKVKLRIDILRVDYHDRVGDRFDFSKYEWPRTVDEKAVALDTKIARRRAQVLKDKILLGDEATALAALDQFAKECGEAS